MTDSIPNSTKSLEHKQPDGSFLMLHVYIPIIIGITGILGNGLVCFIFTYKRYTFKSLTNRLILNQSIIDFILSVIFLLDRVVPKPGSSASGLWINIFCRFWGSEYFLWSMNNVSTGNLVLISLERYFALCHPVKHRNICTSRLVILACLIVYIVGFLWLLYAPILADQKYNCYVVWENKHAQMFVGLFHFLVTYLIPLLFLTLSYGNIWKEISHRQKLRNTSSGAKNPFRRAKRNLTITLFLVALLFVFCVTPASVTYLLFNCGYQVDITSDMTAVLLTLQLMNMIVNPIVYGFTYREFRRQVVLTFKCSTPIESTNKSLRMQTFRCSLSSNKTLDSQNHC